MRDEIQVDNRYIQPHSIKVLSFMHRWNPPSEEFMKELRKKIEEKNR